MIELKDIYKSFGNNRVLEGLDLKIQKGESLVIIGRSGCGKSILLKHIIGLARPDSGNVLISGEDITRMRLRELEAVRKNFGMLFQGSALFDSLSVFENVGFSLLEYSDMPLNDVETRVADCLDMVGLKGIELLKPAELSGGMRKRVALARALSRSPKIILFDEPTTGLDPIMADAINNLIRSLHKRLNVTAVTVTHDMKSAYKIADRIAMLYDKRIIAIGTPDEIKNSQSEIVRQFINGEAKGPIKGVADMI